ncbi:MAG: hypothetical protein QOH28_3504 [Actinomycetota bacterium]|nr:hypothetical protein [Actinomycetota bacterium]
MRTHASARVAVPLRPAEIYAREMCRNITELRGLEPPATREEIEAAARQYVRKVTGIARPGVAVVGAMEAAALEVAAITEELLAGLPQRRQPPRTVPPLRRPEVRRRMGLDASIG